MRRTIVQPADLTGDALAEFKGWLGISRPNEDQMLVDLLGASLAMCEAFTGQAPIEQTVEERVPVKAGRYCLTSRPVRSLTNAELVAVNGERTSLSGLGHSFEFDAAGQAYAELKETMNGQAVAMQVIVGIAPDWSTMPRALRQGIVRLAAYYYRDRDQGQSAQPPASVTALWRPWRIMRLT
ncbi:MAG: hypothetical protein AAF250_14520 [Pseudomonadota bacterium]